MAKAQIKALFFRNKTLQVPVLAGKKLVLSESAIRLLATGIAVLFLFITAFALFNQLAVNRQQNFTEQNRWTLMNAERVANRIKLLILNQTTTAASTQSLFEKSIPVDATENQRVYLLLDSKGIVRASKPENKSWNGLSIANLMSPDFITKTVVNANEMLPTNLANGAGIFLVSYDLQPLSGSLVAYQETAAVQAVWLESFSKLAFLYVVTLLMLGIMVGALHWQARRTFDADNRLIMASDRFDTALDGGVCGLWDWNLMADQIFWSKSMYDVLGMSVRSDFLSYAEIAKRVHPDDHRLDQLVDDLLQCRRKDFDFEFRMKHNLGHYVWLRARAALSPGANPNAPHLVGIVFDISNQKQLDERNQQAELRLKDAVESISEAFVLWDAENKLVLCNSKYKQFHSLPPEVCVPGTHYDIVLAAASQPSVQHLAPTAPGDAPGTGSMEVQLQDGRWLHINERRTKDGGHVSVGTDITAHKLQEESLIKSRRDLMKSAAAAQQKHRETQELNEQMFVMARINAEQTAQAEAANRSKTEFLKNMSHELRTPLNAIKGFSEMMSHEVFGPLGSHKYVEYANDIQKSGQFLLEVINDILDMSKIEAGKTDLEIDTVDINIVLDEALRIIGPRAMESGIHIIRELKSLPKIQADKRSLKQVMLNLLSNAVKFTPEGGKVHIALVKSENNIEIRIQDTGIGIPAKDIGKLGKPFEQVENQFTKSKGGSGLGLAISKSLIDLHQGNLNITSEQNAGTCVTVSLPLLHTKKNQDLLPSVIGKSARAKQ